MRVGTMHIELVSDMLFELASLLPQFCMHSANDTKEVVAFAHIRNKPVEKPRNAVLNQPIFHHCLKYFRSSNWFIYHIPSIGLTLGHAGNFVPP